MKFMNNIIDFVKQYYIKKHGSDEDFEKYLDKYYMLPDFGINENVHDIVDYYDEKLHTILQGFTMYYIYKMFKSLKIRLDDPNVMDGDFGTVYRVMKIFTGKDLEDDTELLSGRFVKEPVLKSFPNTVSRDNEIIVKTFDVVSLCSHHLIPFSTKFRNSYGFIAFKPRHKLIGLSKISRYVRYISRRGWLQEELVEHLHRKFTEKLETDDVMVGILNCTHLCEYIRGIEDEYSSYTTIRYSGIFEDKNVREDVLNQVKNNRTWVQNDSQGKNVSYLVNKNDIL